MNRKLSLFVCASSLLLAPAASAIAADAEAGQGTNAATVQEIVVTVQKREQVLEKVPATATAVTGSTLQQAGAIDIRGVSALVPSLTVTQTVGPVNQSYRIRGMGSEANIPTFEPDVALFVDGVYMPRSGLSIDDLADVARVEVLEGPQSTLYGKNATAGVINVVTEGPSHHWQGMIQSSLSDLDSSLQAAVYRMAGEVSGPITDRVRVLLSGVYYTQGDSYKNLEPGAPNANNMHRYSVRGAIDADLWEGADLRIDLGRSQIFNTRNGDGDVMYYTYPPNANNAYKLDFGPLGKLFGITPCPDNDPNDRVICTTSPWTNASWTDTGSATLTSKLGPDTLTVVSAFTDYFVRDQNGDIAQVLLPLLSYDDTQRGSTFSQEIRLASPGGGKFEWLVGGYYEHANFGRGDNGHTPTFVVGAAGPFVPLPAPLSAFKVGKPGDEGFLNSKESSNYGAIFGQATYKVTDQFSLSAGLRGQIEAKSDSIDNSYVISPLTPTHAFGPCGPIPVNILTALLTGPTTLGCAPINADFHHTTEYLTWNGTADYQVTSDTMVYGTVSRGGKSFGYNLGFGNTPASGREFKDEYVTNYELGVKSRLLDGRARIAASLFYTNERNYQNAGFIGGQFLVDNAERVIVKGAEANGDMILGHGFTANGGVTYVDAVYNNYVGGPCYFGEVPNNGAGGCNLSGKDLPLTPHWRTNFGLQYKRPLSVGDLYARMDWTWQSGMLANSNLDPRSYQVPYSLLNLKLGVKFTDQWDVSIWGHNISNTTYSQADYVSNLFGANDPAFQRYLGRPAEYGVTVQRNF